MFDSLSKKLHAKRQHLSPKSKGSQDNQHSLSGESIDHFSTPSPSPRRTDSFTGNRSTSTPTAKNKSLKQSPLNAAASVKSAQFDSFNHNQASQSMKSPVGITPTLSHALKPASSTKSILNDDTSKRSRSNSNASKAFNASTKSSIGEDNQDDESTQTEYDEDEGSISSEKIKQALNETDTGLNNDNLTNRGRFSVFLMEAVSDTPSFRASIEFIDIQFRSLEKWLIDLATKSQKIVDQLIKVKDSVNELISIFMPSVTHSSILSQDYTTMMFGRFTESESAFWTELLALVIKNSHEVHKMVKMLKDRQLAKYNDTRRKYLQAMKEQDDAITAGLRMPHHSEPAALRDVTFSIYRARKKYLRAASQLVICISDLEAETTVLLLDTMAKRFLDIPNSFPSLDNFHIEVSVEFYRLKAVANSLRESLPGLRNKLKGLRSSLLKDFQLKQPSKSLKDYYEHEVPKLEISSINKSGWVNVQVKQGVWNLMWAYLENGLFGLLTTSESGTAVIESERYDVHDCKFEILPIEDRRCVFNIKNPHSPLIIQTIGMGDLAEWQAVFKASGALLGAVTIDDGSLFQESTNTHFHDWSMRELSPWNQAFSIPNLSTDIAPGSDVVVSKIKDIRKDFNSESWLRYDSTLTSQSATSLWCTVPAVKPMPTSAMLEAIVANSYFKPGGIPNAITGNVWGSLNRTICDGESTDGEARPYDDHFPRYPEYYPRPIVVQDMDMRTITAHLPIEKKVADDDFLLFFIRATTQIEDIEIPVRIYVTSHKFIVYSSWYGFVQLQSFNFANIISIDTQHGVESSGLEITLQDSTVEAAVKSLKFNLYIDSSVLAKQRLELVWKNSRLSEPHPSHVLLEQITIMCIDYSTAVKNDTSRLEDLGRAGNQTSLNHQSDQGSMGRVTIPALLLRNQINSSSSLGESDHSETGGKGMQYKLAEDTFPISAKALFTVIFGPRSPVFAGHHNEILESDVELGPWYRKGRRVERRLSQKIYLDSRGTSSKRYNYQKIDRRDRDIYVVTERSSSWEMPRGDQFYNILRYVVFSAEKGSHIQIWSRVVWQKKFCGSEAEESVRPMSKLIAQAILLRVRDSANLVKSSEDAARIYGKVVPTEVLNENIHCDLPVTRVSVRTMSWIFIRSPFLFTYKRVYWLIVNLLYRSSRIPRSNIFIFILLFLSLLVNLRLFEKSSKIYWSTYMENKEVNKYVDSMKLLQDPTSLVLTRAIYSKDIDDMIADGTLWPSSSNNYTVDFAKNYAVGNNSGCAAKFNELARLTANDFGSLYEIEPRMQEALEELVFIRMDYAVRRDELLTMVRILDAQERETLQRAYRLWLIGEAEMCSNVRSKLHMLDGSVFNQIKNYCVNCLEELKDFI